MWSEDLRMGARMGQVVGGPGALEAQLAKLAGGDLGPVGLIVRDVGVPEAVMAGVRAILAGGTVDVQEATVAGGEAAKSWPVIFSIYDAALGAGVARDGWFLAIGGGAVLDAAGFAAATFLRGIAWAAMPTTLLAQVDAAIGGKTAIDLPQGKNLVGAFHLPAWVALDPQVLESLPRREWRSGFGEVLKCGLLMGGRTWERVQEIPPGWEAPAEMVELAEASARHKCRVVAQDPYEAGERISLNLGHTVGHAWEQVSGYAGPRHGEAVGVGLLAALRLSEQVVHLDPAVRAAVHQALGRWGMPTRLPRDSHDGILRALARDKKLRAGALRWVLLRAPGDPVAMPVSMDIVEDALIGLEA